MRLRPRARIPGIFSFLFDTAEPVEYDEPETDCGIGGGSGHNFERSIDYYYTEPEERGGFGFR